MLLQQQRLNCWHRMQKIMLRKTERRLMKMVKSNLNPILTEKWTITWRVIKMKIKRLNMTLMVNQFLRK